MKQLIFSFTMLLMFHRLCKLDMQDFLSFPYFGEPLAILFCCVVIIYCSNVHLLSQTVDQNFCNLKFNSSCKMWLSGNAHLYEVAEQALFKHIDRLIDLLL